jgi:hypothetical protein
VFQFDKNRFILQKVWWRFFWQNHYIRNYCSENYVDISSSSCPFISRLIYSYDHTTNSKPNVFKIQISKVKLEQCPNQTGIASKCLVYFLECHLWRCPTHILLYISEHNASKPTWEHFCFIFWISPGALTPTHEFLFFSFDLPNNASRASSNDHTLKRKTKLPSCFLAGGGHPSGCELLSHRSQQVSLQCFLDNKKRMCVVLIWSLEF